MWLCYVEFRTRVRSTNYYVTKNEFQVIFQTFYIFINNIKLNDFFFQDNHTRNTCTWLYNVNNLYLNEMTFIQLELSFFAGS